MGVDFRLVLSLSVLAYAAVGVVNAARDMTPCMLYIDPAGSDITGTGTMALPFATLPRALNASGTTPVPIGEDLTICLNAGTYASGWNTTAAGGGGPNSFGGVWYQPGNAAYNTLRIRSTAADPAKVTLVPQGYLIIICRSLTLSSITLTDAFTVEILAGAPAGMVSTFDSLIVTGNGALTWDADPSQATLSTLPATSTPAATTAPVAATPVRTGGPDDFPFILSNSLFTACTIQSPSPYVMAYPVYAFNKGSGSMHISNVLWQNFAGAAGTPPGAQTFARFDSVDADPNTDNHIHLTNISVIGNNVAYGFAVNGGDIVIDAATFQLNVVPDPAPYLLTMTAASLILRNSTFQENYNTGAVDIEILTAQGQPPPAQPLILIGNYFFDNTHWYTDDSSDYLFPSALSVETAWDVPLVLTSNYWSCNSIQTADGSLVYAPPIGVRVSGNGAVTPVMRGDTTNSDCPVVCPAPVLPGQFSPCGLFACTQCSAGHVPIANATGCRAVTDCMACPAGTFTPDTASCRNCAVDSYSATASSVACSACDHTQGQYQPSTGQSTCLQCAAGSIITTILEPAPLVTCTACPAGKSSGPFSGAATSCSDCAAGTYSAGNAVACPACNATYYQPATAASSCLYCDGTVSADRLSCSPKPAGGDTCTASFWKKSDCSVSGGGVAVIIILVLAVSGGVGVICWKRGFNSAPANAHVHASINDADSSGDVPRNKPSRAKINQQPLLGAADQL